MSGVLGKKPDNSAAERQIAEQRAQTEQAKVAADEERRDLMEQQAAKKRARTRGGSRMLLANVRYSPEAGIETLGSEMTKGV
mgnify:CR=1 FL=1|jgi:hypothetical protein